MNPRGNSKPFWRRYPSIVGLGIYLLIGVVAIGFSYVLLEYFDKRVYWWFRVGTGTILSVWMISNLVRFKRERTLGTVVVTMYVTFSVLDEWGNFLGKAEQ